MLSNQLKNKEDYHNIKPVIQINFDDFEINKKNKRPVKRCFIKDESNTIISDLLEIDHINIDKCYKIWYSKTIEESYREDIDLIRIGALLKIQNIEDFKRCLEEIDMSKIIKEDIVDTALEFSSDEDMWLYYDKEQNDLAIRNGDISQAREEGIKEGIEKEKFHITKKMLEKGIDLETISNITDLPIDTIKNLK